MAGVNRMKQKVYEVQVPLYGIYIHYSNDPELILEQYGESPVNNLNGFCCYDLGNRCIGMHIPHDKGALAIPTLGHEVFHAAMQVGDFVGLEPTLNANEEIAYLISWLTGWILDCVDKDVKRLKKGR